MLSPRHLTNAPIVEALLDIRVKLPSDTVVTTLDSIHKLISGEYPGRQERRSWESKFEVKKGELLPPQQKFRGVDGYRYISEDEKQVIQARLNGFSFSRLRPYQTWERLRDEAFRHWKRYVEIAHPETITRVALRYINRLEIALPIELFEDWLTAPPIIPESLPQAVSSFLTRIVIRKEPIGNAIITQALEAEKDNMLPIILDVDVFEQREFPVEGKEAWEKLEELHIFKNEIFFGSITQKTMELYL